MYDAVCDNVPGGCRRLTDVPPALMARPVRATSDPRGLRSTPSRKLGRNVPKSPLQTTTVHRYKRQKQNGVFPGEMAVGR
jgi:hypothetical protein